MAFSGAETGKTAKTINTLNGKESGAEKEPSTFVQVYLQTDVEGSFSISRPANSEMK